MKLRKILALLLSAIMVSAVLTGCNQTAKSPFVSSDPSAEVSTTGEADVSEAPSAMNTAGAYASLDPKTVMLTINGDDVTWDKLFYYINYAIYNIQSQGDPISDWAATLTDDMTYEDYVLNSASNLALQYGAIQYGAEQLNVTLTEEDKAAIQADWEQRVSEAGSEEALIAQFQDQYLTKDLFEELSGFTRLVQSCLTSMFGTEGNDLTDEEVAEYTAQDGYLMAKHILMLMPTDDTEDSTASLDDEKAEVRDKMEDILSQLKSYTGSDFPAYFDELMNQYSEDSGGLSMFPDGYLFQSADMVSEFSDETKALEIGEFSQELVETEYGYHIVYRLPLNYDVTPMAYSNSGTYSLRYIAAHNMFGSVADTWLDGLNVVYSEQYNALDFAKIFAAG